MGQPDHGGRPLAGRFRWCLVSCLGAAARDCVYQARSCLPAHPMAAGGRMTIRTNLSDIAVSPFQFPPLKQNDTAMEAVASGLAAVLQDAADAGASAPP